VGLQAHQQAARRGAKTVTLSVPLHKYAGIRSPLHPRPLRSAPCDVLSEYASVARLAGAAHRHSRCITVFMERNTWPGLKNLTTDAFVIETEATEGQGIQAIPGVQDLPALHDLTDLAKILQFELVPIGEDEQEVRAAGRI
jgi:hypothetical protein